MILKVFLLSDILLNYTRNFTCYARPWWFWGKDAAGRYNELVSATTRTFLRRSSAPGSEIQTLSLTIQKGSAHKTYPHHSFGGEICTSSLQLLPFFFLSLWQQFWSSYAATREKFGICVFSFDQRRSDMRHRRNVSCGNSSCRGSLCSSALSVNTAPTEVKTKIILRCFIFLHNSRTCSSFGLLCLPCCHHFARRCKKEISYRRQKENRVGSRVSDKYFKTHSLFEKSVNTDWGWNFAERENHASNRRKQRFCEAKLTEHHETEKWISLFHS